MDWGVKGRRVRVALPRSHFQPVFLPAERNVPSRDHPVVVMGDITDLEG
jgi:hypothetical protein